MRRIDLGLVACGLGFHDPILVSERAIYPARTVRYRRCRRCLRNPDQRGAYR